ncbi:MAG: GAF domain-containing protein [Ruminococcaceae bacterium]|nr:GAF domain-containing protein [Oscillospiraceae bacterium]
MTDYSLLCRNLSALTEGVPYETANLANASALLWEYLPELNWAGFYKMMGGKLVLGPFQGKTACIEIEIGHGVCGTAVAENKTQLVYNVHEFPGHIACDCASNSEIVVPIRVDGKTWGVLDIDSPVIGRFSEDDKEGLEEFVKILEKVLSEKSAVVL